MRVFHINSNYLGNSLHAILVSQLKQFGIKSLVFCPIRRHHGNIVNKEDVNVTKDSLLVPILRRWDNFLYRLRIWKIVRAVLDDCKTFAPDLMHAYTLFSDGGVAYQLHKTLGVPYVVAIRNSDVNVYLRYMWHLRGYGEKILKSASAIFFLSDTYRRKVFEDYLAEETVDEISFKTYVIPNGIKPFWLENTMGRVADANGKDIRVVAIGDMVKNKNIECVAKALAVLQCKGYRVTLHGAAETCNSKILARLQKYDFFEFHGLIGKKDLMELYRQSDVFALVSFHESFGAVYPEAMSQGLPIVYTKGEGFDGWFKDGEVGYSADPYDVNDVAEKIEMAFLHRREIAPRSVEGARRFDWSKIAQQYVGLYKEIKD